MSDMIDLENLIEALEETTDEDTEAVLIIVSNGNSFSARAFGDKELCIQAAELFAERIN